MTASDTHHLINHLIIIKKCIKKGVGSSSSITAMLQCIPGGEGSPDDGGLVGRFCADG